MLAIQISLYTIVYNKTRNWRMPTVGSNDYLMFNHEML